MCEVIPAVSPAAQVHTHSPSPDTPLCGHMEQMAWERNYQRDPETGRYRVLMCGGPTTSMVIEQSCCGKIVPVGAMSCSSGHHGPFIAAPASTATAVPLFTPSRAASRARALALAFAP